MNYKELETQLKDISKGFHVKAYEASNQVLQVSLCDRVFAKINDIRTVSFTHNDEAGLIPSNYKKACFLILMYADKYSVDQMIGTDKEVKMSSVQAKMVKGMVQNQLNYVDRGSSKYFDLVGIQSNIDNAFQPPFVQDDDEDEDDEDDDWI